MRDATLTDIDERCDFRLGWSEELDAAWRATGLAELPGRVTRLDRGWSTVLRNLDAEPLARAQHRRRSRGRRLGRAVGRARSRRGGAAAPECVRSSRLVRGQPRRVPDDRRQHRCRDAGARADLTSQPAAAGARAGARVGQRSPPGRRADQARSRRRPHCVGRVAARGRAGRDDPDRQRHHRRGVDALGRVRRGQRDDRTARRQRGRARAR